MAQREHRDHEPPRVVRYELGWRTLLALAVIILGPWFWWQLIEVIQVVVIALILVGTLAPLVGRIEQRGIGRPFALALVGGTLALAVIGVGFLVIPALLGQVMELIGDAAELQARLAAAAAGLPATAAYADQIRSADPARYLAPVRDYALAYADTALQLVIYGIITIVLAFYIIADRERVGGFFFALLPKRYHLRAARILIDMESVVGSYMRGQGITSLAMGTFTYLLLTVLGAPGALPIAVFAAFANLIPFIGTLLASIPIILAALSVGVTPAIIAAVASVLYEQVEGRLLIPHVYGRAMHLSPVAVTVALLVGGALLGIIGALLALPIAAGVRVLIEDLHVDLPGDEMDEDAPERQREALAEAYLADRTHHASAVESAVMATELAEALEEEEEEAESEAPDKPTRSRRAG